MNITVNITEPVKRVQEFREYDLGQITTTLQDLLDSSSIIVDSNIIPILKVLSIDNIIKFYLIKDLTENLYNTEDYITGQDLIENDLIPFVSESQIIDLQNKLEDALIIQQSTYMGTAVIGGTPSGSGARYWTATQAGTYTNFGGVIVSANSFAVISRDSLGAFSISQTPLDLTTYQKTVDSNLSDAISEKRKINVSRTNDFYIDTLGVKKSAAGVFYTAPIAVKNGQRIKFYGKGGSTMNAVSVANSDGTFTPKINWTSIKINTYTIGEFIADGDYDICFSAVIGDFSAFFLDFKTNADVYPFVKKSEKTLLYSKYIKDLSIINGEVNKLYSLKEIYMNPSVPYIKIGVYMSNLDGSNPVQIANKAIAKTDLLAGLKIYDITLNNDSYIRLLGDFTGVENELITFEGLNLDLQFEPIVAEGGRFINDGIPKNIYPFEKPFFTYFQKEALNIVKAIKDVSITGAVVGRNYFFSQFSATYTPTSYFVELKSALLNGSEIRLEAAAIVNAEYIDDYREYNILPDSIGLAGFSLLLNFKLLKDSNVQYAIGSTSISNAFNVFVFKNRLKGGNDAIGITQSELDAELAALDFPSYEYLQANYKTGTQTDLDRQAALNTLQIATNQITGQAVTAEKIALDVWNQMTAGNVTITNNPDENDIEAVSGALRLKENENHIFLRKGTSITPAIVATWANKTVVIRHGHNLPASVSLPSNVTLVFKGGYISASTVFATPFAANNCKIIAHPKHWIFRNVFNHLGQYFHGANTFNAVNSYPEWFGSDNGISHGKCINLCSTQFPKVDIILSPNKIYTIDKEIYAQSQTIYGYGATVQRDVSIDLNVTSEITTGTGEMIVTVENNTAELAKLKVGQRFVTANREGAARKVGNGSLEIVAINGTTLTLHNHDAVYWAAGTASLVNLFPMIVCDGDGAAIRGLKIDGKKANFTHTRKYWENATNILSYVKPLNLSIRDCIVINSPSEGIMGGCINGEITHNFIAHHGGNGIHMSQCNGLNITKNIITDTNQLFGTVNNKHNDGNIAYSAIIYNVLISENILDNGLCGIGGMHTTWSSDIRIIGNVFKRYRVHGIDGVAKSGETDYLREVRDIVISGNKFYGFEVLKVQEFNTTSDIVYPNGATGSAIQLESSVLGIFRNVTISANLFINTCFFALKVEGLSVTGNVFNEQGVVYSVIPKLELITLKDCLGVFSGNTIINKTTSARSEMFLVNNRDMLISSNTIDSDKPILNEKSSNYLFKGNVIKANVTVTNKGRFRNNTVTGTITVGVAGQDNTKLLVSDNEVEHATNTITIISGVTASVIKDNFLFGADLLDSGTSTVKIGNLVI